MITIERWKQLKVLIACEESQVICTEFRKLGHKAFSCDLAPCSGGHPEWHIQHDVTPLLNGNCMFHTQDGIAHAVSSKWDIIIAHPPCTYLSSVNNRHMSLRINPPEKVEARRKLMMEAFEFFMKFANADCDHIAIENPQGYVSTLWRKPDQTIHPYMFAESMDDVDNYQMKRTCFWLKGLPLLERTNDFPKPEPVKTYINSSGKVKRRYWEEDHQQATTKGKRDKDAVARSKTFPRVGAEIARQWGGYVKHEIESEE